MIKLDAPVYMIAFTPHGASRGDIVATWPEGKATCFDMFGGLICVASDCVGRGWDLDQFARHQCGIASRQIMSIGFCCDHAVEVDRIEEIVHTEFPTLKLHPRGRTTKP